MPRLSLVSSHVVTRGLCRSFDRANRVV